MKIVWHDKKVLAAIMEAEGRAMASACQFLTDEVKDSMIDGTGNWWRSKRPEGGMHQASIPGVPPAPDTEELKNSISWATSTGQSGGAESGDPKITPPSSVVGNSVEGRVGTTNDKGVRHELGWTTHGDQRPFLRPALLNNQKEILAILGKYKI